MELVYLYSMFNDCKVSIATFSRRVYSVRRYGTSFLGFRMEEKASIYGG